MTCLVESNVNLAHVTQYPCFPPDQPGYARLPVTSVEPTNQKVKNNIPRFAAASRPGGLAVNPEDLIWLELSFVQTIERVYVTREGNVFDVLIVVNERNPKGRSEIYAREKAIINILPQYGFNFNILARMNYELKDLLTDSEKPAYVRRP